MQFGNGVVRYLASIARGIQKSYRNTDRWKGIVGLYKRFRDKMWQRLHLTFRWVEEFKVIKRGEPSKVLGFRRIYSWALVKGLGIV
jgi:hypothetical protein